MVKRIGLILSGRLPAREGAAVIYADGDARRRQGHVGRFRARRLQAADRRWAMCRRHGRAQPQPSSRSRCAASGHDAVVVTAMPFVPHRYVRSSKA